MATSTSTSSSTSTTRSQSTENTQSSQQTQGTQSSQSTTKSLLDTALRDAILAGLAGGMSDEEIGSYAQSLLRPTLSAGLEASQQQYEASRLGYEQEMDNLAVQLAQAIEKQQQSYRQSDAGLETAALSRGMGRSSYLLDTKAQLSRALSDTVRSLTDESQRQSTQIAQKITLAAQQNAQTQGRLNTDYASQLAAKIQELRDAQRKEFNQNYMTATSAAMGSQTSGLASSSSQTTGTSTTTGTSQSQTQQNTTSTTVSGGGGGRRKTTSANTYTVDEYVSGGANRKQNLTIN